MMLKRERLIAGTKWMLENAPQEKIVMRFYWCGTSGCWLGWLAQCPALNEEGFGGGPIFYIDGKRLICWHGDELLGEFFNLTDVQQLYLFSDDQSGHKADILNRLHAVLQQPGPFAEPEIDNLDEEWRVLQAMVPQEEVYDQR